MVQHTKESGDTIDPTELGVKELKARALSVGFRNLLQWLKILKMRESYSMAIPLEVMSALGREHLRPSDLLDLLHTDRSFWGVYINLVTDSTGEANHWLFESPLEEQPEPFTQFHDVNNQSTTAWLHPNDPASVM
ncbi:hypothetical protein FIE12Z_11418 [Fusarium flagelliforme]|uniref:Uncharacterized protein n=1 Tax=Fusarium flagelliforme TaxID=2675880 RepID=A0A395M954_9HYPO|nr:hypothetical protein FIE12Z_11418 [Fusarium flagelliforme]